MRRLPVFRPVVVSSRIGLPAMKRPPTRPLVRRYRVTCSHKIALASSCMASSPGTSTWSPSVCSEILDRPTPAPKRPRPDGPGALLPSCASRLLVPAPCRAVGLIFSNRHPRPSNGRQHHQHRTDPEQHQRETTDEVLVGGPAGASIAVSHRGVKQESGCHQGNAENLNGATHLSSLQVRGAHQAHLT